VNDQIEEIPRSAKYRYGQVLAVLEKTGVIRNGAISNGFAHPLSAVTRGLQNLHGHSGVEWAHKRISEILAQVSPEELAEVNVCCLSKEQGEVALGYYHEKHVTS
jgi:hypothetical protein